MELIECANCHKEVPDYEMTGCCANVAGCCDDEDRTGRCKNCEECCPVAHDYIADGETQSNWDKMWDELIPMLTKETE